jgi:N-methylhydantoinase B
MPDEDTTGTAVDAISVGIIRSGLVSISREMGVTLRQTAYSTIFNEGADFSCGLFGAQGQLIAQGEFLPIHLGALQFAVRAAIDEVGPGAFDPGDTVLLNDPYRGGSHLPDLTAVSPIFVDTELVGFAANRAHHADVGGGVSGSFYSRARENFQEGLRVPPVKLYRRGELDHDIANLILNNVRVPSDMRGDLEAQVSANRTAVKRFREFCGRYGTETIDRVVDEICLQSERRMRAVIRSWPDGDYVGEDYMENDGIVDEPIRIRVTIRVRGDKLTVDFEGTGRQARGPINAAPGMTASAVYLTLQAATDPTIPANDGCYRPITIDAPPGCLVNPDFPAACTGGNECAHRIVNTVMRALSALPHGPRVMACDHGSSNNLFIDALDVRGDRTILYQYPEGGWGALPFKDGVSALFSVMGNCPNTPAEALELRFPIRLVRYELRQDSGGAGRWRGGLGTRRDYEILSEEADLAFVADRCKIPPYGLAGGAPAAPGGYRVDRGAGLQDASPEFISKGTEIPLRRGDVVVQESAGGGGYGAPAERPLETVRADVEAGYVSVAAAEASYGVTVTVTGAQVTVERLPTNGADADA